MFSKESLRYNGSAIRELLKYANEPGVISLGGGLPNPETFPTMGEISDLLKSISLEKALQYSRTEGTDELRDAIVEFMSKKGINLTRENVLITTGSQQGIFLASKLLINEGEKIIVENPTYVGAVGPFSYRNADAIPIKLEKDGMDIDEIKSLYGIRSVYTIPTFQNPSGITMSEEKRKKLVDLADEKYFYIIEDDPYSYLRYSGDEIPPIKKFDDKGRVIYLGTFSKIFAPGLRVGWVAASEEVIQKMALYKQVIDLHTPTLNQLLVAEALNQGIIDKVISKAKGIYKHKRDLMLSSLEEYVEGATWTNPDGGLFLWLTLNNKYIDTKKMFPKALDEGILYVYGSAFSMNKSCKNSLRLNFSYPSDEEIVEGVKRLSVIFG